LSFLIAALPDNPLWSSFFKGDDFVPPLLRGL
jgi:hypothetical protein